MRSCDTRARDSSIAVESLSISAPLGWKSGSISEGTASAIAPMGARFEPSLMKAATSTSKAMGAQFDVLVAAFIKVGSNLAPIGAIAQAGPPAKDPGLPPHRPAVRKVLRA